MTTATELLAEGRVVERGFGGLRVTRVIVGHWAFASVVSLDEMRWPFALLLVCEGTVALRGPLDRDLAPGDLLMLGSDEEHQLRATPDGEFVLLRIPREALRDEDDVVAGAVGRPVNGASGTALLVARLLTALAHDASPRSPDAKRLTEHVVGMIALMCHEGAAPAGSGRGALLQRAKDYTERHLGDLDLSPDRIADSLNISTRTLYRLFEAEGTTLTTWTRSRRLEHCRAELLDPAFDAYSVSAIGARWGLWDAAHFSRLFKSTYGSSPRAFRVAAGDR